MIKYLCLESLFKQKLTAEIVSGSGSIMRQVEKPLSVPFDVKLIDPYNNEPCDAIWRYLEDGKKVRVSKQSGREIPLTPAAFSTIDYFKKLAYKRKNFIYSLIFAFKSLLFF